MRCAARAPVRHASFTLDRRHKTRNVVYWGMLLLSAALWSVIHPTWIDQVFFRIVEFIGIPDRCARASARSWQGPSRVAAITSRTPLSPRPVKAASFVLSIALHHALGRGPWFWGSFCLIAAILAV